MKGLQVQGDNDAINLLTGPGFVYSVGGVTPGDSGEVESSRRVF